jgi:membrane protease YdiL (CAAX protease family)
LRIPRSLAWILILSGFFTAGLLRTHHLETPRSPWVPIPVGSLLFACILFLLLVAARERRAAAVPGAGVRLGNLTPLLLILFLEKWASINLYRPSFAFLIGSREIAPHDLDAYWRAFAAAGLLAVTLVAATFSLPAARTTWERARPGRIPSGVGIAVLSALGSYAVLGGLAASRLDGVRFAIPGAPGSDAWVLGGQVALAFGEEIYYRGLVLHEVLRLTPRLGIRAVAGRRWTALGLSAALFAFEHLSPALDARVAARETVFALALGLLFGLLVLVARNLWLAAALHAWINALLLGAAPRFATVAGEPVFGPGAYVAVALALAVVAAAGFARTSPSP